jgi:hypothetical protein
MYGQLFYKKIFFQAQSPLRHRKNPARGSAPAEGLSHGAGHGLNDAGVAVFLCLPAETEDTNIVHRSNPGELWRIREETSGIAFLVPSSVFLLYWFYERS